MTVALAPWWVSAVFDSIAELFLYEHISAPKYLSFWGWMAIACALEVPGNFLLLRSIQRTDLSVFGPLSSYKPIVGMLLGWLILSEFPTMFGLVGMGIVLGGSLLLADRSRNESDVGVATLGLKSTGIQDRLIAVALTAAGSIFLKLAMQHQDELTSLAAWSFVSWLLALTWLIVESLGRSEITSEFDRSRSRSRQTQFFLPRFEL